MNNSSRGQMNRWGKNGARWLRAMGLGLLTALLSTAGMAATAHANPFPDPEMDGQASLTIHKLRLEERQGASGNGLPVSGFDEAQLLDGIEFTLRQVQGIDLRTNEGWQEAAQLADDGVDALLDSHTLGEAVSLITGAHGQPSGQAVFENLALGAYVVEETFTPVGVIASDPFVITLPLTHPTERDSWLYDVHVYPKNEIVDGSKEVKDSSAVIAGSELEYIITAPVPTISRSDYYLVTDTLPIQTEYVAHSLQVGLSNGDTWQQGVEYIFRHENQTLEIELTEAGLQTSYEAAIAEGADLIVKFGARVRADFGGVESGEFTNMAQIYPNSPAWENELPLKPSVTSKWGNLELIKVDAEDSAQALQGATFQVWYGNSGDYSHAQPIMDGDVPREWVSDADGLIQIQGLRYSAWADGGAVAIDEPGYLQYWLVEVAAPHGYQLLSQPVPFVIDELSVSQRLMVQNVKEPREPILPEPPLVNTGVMLGFLIPLTGGLLAGGIGLLKARRSNKE